MNAPLQIALPANTNFWDNPNVFMVDPNNLVPDTNNSGYQIPNNAPTTPLSQVVTSKSYVAVVVVQSTQQGPVSGVVGQVAILKPSLLSGGNVLAALFDPSLVFTSVDQPGVNVAAQGLQPIVCWLGGIPGVAWTPTHAQLTAGDPGGHVCMAATTYLNTDEQTLQLKPFLPNGVADGNAWQGQRNIHIIEVPGGQGNNRHVNYRFFAANPATTGAARQVEVHLVAAHPGAVIKPRDIELLRTMVPGPHRFLPGHFTALRPVLRQGHLLGEFGGSHVLAASEPLLHPVEAGEFHATALPPEAMIRPLPVHGHRLTAIGLTLEPKALHPLSMDLVIDPREQPGSVQVFNVVQTDSAGHVMGGIHILAVVV